MEAGSSQSIQATFITSPPVLVFCEDAESKKQALEIQPTYRPDLLCL